MAEQRVSDPRKESLFTPEFLKKLRQRGVEMASDPRKGSAEELLENLDCAIKAYAASLQRPQVGRSAEEFAVWFKREWPDVQLHWTESGVAYSVYTLVDPQPLWECWQAATDAASREQAPDRASSILLHVCEALGISALSDRMEERLLKRIERLYGKGRNKTSDPRKESAADNALRQWSERRTFSSATVKEICQCFLDGYDAASREQIPQAVPCIHNRSDEGDYCRKCGADLVTEGKGREQATATPQSSVIYTDLHVVCEQCGTPAIWRYDEEKDQIRFKTGTKCCERPSESPAPNNESKENK